LKELQKHRNDKKCCVDDFKCKKCDKSYKCETDLETHQKTYGNLECGQCECKYDSEGQLEKHVSAVHGKFKIFCHYHNNDKDCPFEGRCIFAREESPDCRFGQLCERVMFMFAHEERDVSDSEDKDDSDDENDDDENNEDEHIEDEHLFKVKNIEPSLRKVEEAMDKIQQL